MTRHLLLDTQGFVAEGAGRTCSSIKDGKTNPEIASALTGITRDSVIQVAREFGPKSSPAGLPGRHLHCRRSLSPAPPQSHALICELDNRVISSGTCGTDYRKLQTRFRYRQWSPPNTNTGFPSSERARHDRHAKPKTSPLPSPQKTCPALPGNPEPAVARHPRVFLDVRQGRWRCPYSQRTLRGSLANARSGHH